MCGILGWCNFQKKPSIEVLRNLYINPIKLKYKANANIKSTVIIADT